MSIDTNKLVHRDIIVSLIDYLCNSLEITRKELADIFSNSNITLSKLDSDIEVGIKNGYNPDLQLELFKYVFTYVTTEFNPGEI